MHPTQGKEVNKDHPPLGLAAIMLLLIGSMAITTVLGSIKTNMRVSEPLRVALARERTIAEGASLDILAVRRGKAEFMKTCTACHGPNGEALPNLGKDLAHSEFVAGKSDSGLRMFLKLGRNTWDAENTTGVAMPPKGGNPMITDDDLVDLVAFVRYLQAAAKQ